jgi:hypothetical protein
MVKRGVRRSRSGRTSRRSIRLASAPKVGKLNAYGFGHAFGIVSIIALLFYAVMYWFGGYNSSMIINQYPLGFSFDDWTIIIGVVQTYVLGYIGGWIFVKVYNRSLRG